MNTPDNISPDLAVTILMGVCNGAAHLPQQLDSIARQTHPNWRLICSDDGSMDQSREILCDFARAHPDQVTIANGPQTGFSDNYMSMIRTLPDQPGHICFADQDDIWLAGKVARGFQTLDVARGQPALYCGRHFYWHPGTGRKVASRQMTRPFSLRNALIENVASGNTVMLNPAAARLARQAAQHTGHVFAHDWWLYLLMTATGGQVCFDNDAPSILYRQHQGNAIGSGQGLALQFRRKIGVVRGLFSQRIEGNLCALNAIQNMLTPEARSTIATFSEARHASGLARISAFRTSALYRQTRSGTLGYWGAASLGRV